MEWAEEQFEQKYAKVEERLVEDLPDEEKADLAVGMIQSAMTRDERIGGGGEETELKILAVGASRRGIVENWGRNNATVTYTYGIVRGPIGENDKMGTGKAVFINMDDHLDLHEVREKFHARNTLEATYEVSESNDLNGIYRCFSCDATELVETDFDDLPSDPDEKNDMLRQIFPDVPLAEVHENLSKFDPNSDGNWPYEFGADIKRFRGRVVDYYINDERSWGRYTLMDDSVTEDDIEPGEVTLPTGDAGHITGEQQNIPGFTVHCDPTLHMNYGRDSVLDVYGVIEADQDGQVVMSAVGVVPIVPMGMDEDEAADEGVQAKESQI